MSIDYNCEFPGLPQNDETCFRFSNKSIQENERILFSNSSGQILASTGDR